MSSSVSRSPRLSRDSRQLIMLAESLALSSCRLEDTYWEKLLLQQLGKALQGRKSKSIEAALEQLLDSNIDAYEILVEHAETWSESAALTVDNIEYEALLFSAPLVAWTRYQLPQGELSQATREGLAQGLRECVLADGTRLVLLDQLVCFEQMPQTFQETRAWTEKLGLAALEAKTDLPRIAAAPDSDSMLADARFLIGAIVVDRGGALFRWQTDPAGAATAREKSLQSWTLEATRLLGPSFTGCNIEYLLPDSYYMNSREADRRVRPLALKAAVTWLQSAMQLGGKDLRAVIAGCGEATIEEYRVGFSARQNSDVIYGCIWPILSKEEALAESTENEQADIPDEIAALLKDLGVTDVKRLPGIYKAEFCDDCGAPYFPNALGEMLHPELPEETDLNPVHFH